MVIRADSAPEGGRDRWYVGNRIHHRPMLA
jgi:hypothetical protein